MEVFSSRLKWLMRRCRRGLSLEVFVTGAGQEAMQYQEKMELRLRCPAEDMQGTACSEVARKGSVETAAAAALPEWRLVTLRPGAREIAAPRRVAGSWGTI